MIDALIKSLEAGLSLWASKEKRKYLDKVISLKRDFYEEYNKPDDDRSDAVMDNIRLQLRIVANGFSTSLKTENSKDS